MPLATANRDYLHRTFAGCVLVSDMESWIGDEARASTDKKYREPLGTLRRLTSYNQSSTFGPVVRSCRFSQKINRLSRLPTMMSLRPSITNERKGICNFAGQPANSLPAHPLRL